MGDYSDYSDYSHSPGLAQPTEPNSVYSEDSRYPHNPDTPRRRFGSQARGGIPSNPNGPSSAVVGWLCRLTHPHVAVRQFGLVGHPLCLLNIQDSKDVVSQLSLRTRTLSPFPSSPEALLVGDDLGKSCVGMVGLACMDPRSRPHLPRVPQFLGSTRSHVAESGRVGKANADTPEPARVEQPELAPLSEKSVTDSVLGFVRIVAAKGTQTFGKKLCETCEHVGLFLARDERPRSLQATTLCCCCHVRRRQDPYSTVWPPCTGTTIWLADVPGHDPSLPWRLYCCEIGGNPNPGTLRSIMSRTIPNHEPEAEVTT